MMEGHLSQPDSSPQKVAVKTMKRKSSPWTCRAWRCLSPWVLVFLLPVSVALSAPWHHLWGCEEGTLTSNSQGLQRRPRGPFLGAHAGTVL